MLSHLKIEFQISVQQFMSPKGDIQINQKIRKMEFNMNLFVHISCKCIYRHNKKSTYLYMYNICTYMNNIQRNSIQFRTMYVHLYFSTSSLKKRAMHGYKYITTCNYNSHIVEVLMYSITYGRLHMFERLI